MPRLYGKVMLTPRIWEEAIAIGKAIGAIDAAYLEKSARELHLARVRLTAAEREIVRRLKQERAGSGEAEVLAIAKRRKALAILDDKDARAFAVGLGVAHVGTVGVLYEAFLHRLISYEEIIELLEKLSKVAWITPDLLARIIKQAREVEK